MMQVKWQKKDGKENRATTNLFFFEHMKRRASSHKGAKSLCVHIHSSDTVSFLQGAKDGSVVNMVGPFALHQGPHFGPPQLE